MNSRPSTSTRPSNLSIRPPSPSLPPPPPPLLTPTHTGVPQYYHNHNNQGIASPRRAPLPPSPTYSNTSYTSSGTKGSSGLGVGAGNQVPPPLPAKTDKRLPPPPPLFFDNNDARSVHSTRGSPRSQKSVNGKGWAGAVNVYDNKLVSSTLSHLPPLPPLSPSPSTSSYPQHQHPSSSSLLHPSSSSSLTTATARPSLSSSTNSNSHSHPHPHSQSQSQAQSSGVIVFGDGTPLSDHAHSSSLLHDPLPLVERTIAHSSPNSPWSLLTVHVLPLFAGSALKTPLEDLNQLCNSHIILTSQRSPATRVIGLLSSDLREFIASGMLTLKSKFETLEEAKVVSRAAEVWSFFWAQVLPYVEGVFLPFTQLRDVPASAMGSSSYLSSLSSPIPVRHLLLSGFLLHILLPLLPRLIPQITSTSSAHGLVTPTTQDLTRLLQMSLVLSTQAKYSAFFPSTGGSVDRDAEVRDNVEGLQRAVRWRTQQNEIEANTREMDGLAADLPIKNAAAGSSLQRGASLTQSGRYRRRGWRASAQASASGFGQLGLNGGGMDMSRQNSDTALTNTNGNGNGNGNGNTQDTRWGRPRLDEEDEDDDYTPSNRGLAPPPRHRTDTSDSLTGGGGGSMMSGGSSSTATATAGTIGIGMSNFTLTAGTATTRGESLASYGETPTPNASTAGMYAARGDNMVYGRPLRMRTGSTGSSDVSAANADQRGVGRRI